MVSNSFISHVVCFSLFSFDSYFLNFSLHFTKIGTYKAYIRLRCCSHCNIQPRPQGHYCGRVEEIDDPGKGCKNLQDSWRFSSMRCLNYVALTQVTTGTEHWRANFHNVYRNLRSHKNNI